MSSTRTVRSKEDVEQHSSSRTNDQCRQSIRLTLQDHHQSSQNSQQHNEKEAPAKQNSLERPHTSTPNHITPTEVEVIKVYLEPRQKHKEESHRDSSAKMLTDEVSQIQEVRYCLKTLREQMAARQNNNNNKCPVNGYRVTMPCNQAIVTNDNIVGIQSDMHVKDHQEETERLREVTKRLYTQLKEGEKRQQEEIHKLQAEKSELCRQLDVQAVRLQKAEGQSEERGQRVEELERLLGGMEIESAILKDKMAAGEAELLQLKAERDEGKLKRSEELEKEVALLKEKIHHLDDMLKSQQRKVRHMIEQLQNSRTIMQDRDRFIGDLEEKVAFLEAENREMQDHMEYFLGGQSSETQTSTENKPQVVYSKPLTPSTHSKNKQLPFIKVIEIKS